MTIIETKPRRWLPEGSSIIVGPALSLILWLFGFVVGWFLSPYILGAI